MTVTVVFMIMVLVILICLVWSFVRFCRYALGAHSEHIYLPQEMWISCILGFWIPILNVIVFIYILFVCKSVERLVAARNHIIQSMTPTEVVEATENLILGNGNLLSDQWVVEIWKKMSKSDWIKRLSANDPLLRVALEQKIKIHASSMLPFAAWVEVVQHFLYIEQRESGS